MRMRWTVYLEKSGEWFRGKGGLELPGITLSHRAEPGKALQCLELAEGRGLCLPPHLWHLCLLQDWPEDP